MAEDGAGADGHAAEGGEVDRLAVPAGSSCVGSRVSASNFARGNALGSARSSALGSARGSGVSSARSGHWESVPASPSMPPEEVRRMVREEDWEALCRAWMDAETRADEWIDGELDDIDGYGDEIADRSLSMEGAEAEGFAAGRRRARRRKPWDESWSQLGSDKGRPMPLRRYFDSLPAETSPPRTVTGLSPGISIELPTSPSQFSPERSMHSPSMPSTKASHRPPWDEMWNSLPSSDNPGIHPHLRHYFDRRGLEASFRMRPHVDSPSLQRLRPRTPGKPELRELVLKFSASAPSLGATSGGHTFHFANDAALDVKERAKGDITWGQRCQLFGANLGAQAKSTGRQKIPWVSDFHLGSTLGSEPPVSPSSGSMSPSSPSTTTRSRLNRSCGRATKAAGAGISGQLPRGLSAGDGRPRRLSLAD